MVERLAMTRTHRLLGGLLALLLVASSCGSDDAASTTTIDSGGASASTDTADSSDDAASDEAVSDGSTVTGVEAAQWGDNVEITLADASFRFASNGLPNHELPDQFLVPNDGNMPPFDGDDIAAEFNIANTDDLIVESPLDVEITLNPVYSEDVTQTSLATIGVMISGAPLFNDYEDQSREFVALDDNLSLDGVFFIDACNGHPLATGDAYHYHGVPYCITDDVDVEGEHSTIIGVLLDGFPIYGPQGTGGVTLSNADLDECSGHIGATPEFLEGIYHYHLTEDANPYSIDCFHGEIDYGGDAQGGPPPGAGEGEADGDVDDAGSPPVGGAPDFTDAATALGVSVEELNAALGQPPFDLDAAATTLGVSAEDLEAALPAPPEGGAGGGGAPPPEEG